MYHIINPNHCIVFKKILNDNNILCYVDMTYSAFTRLFAVYSPNLDVASRASGILLIILLIYNGYLIPLNDVKPWFIWVVYLNPLAYAFKALMANEFRGLQLECSGTLLIPPYGSLQNQVCAINGAKPGYPTVDGVRGSFIF